MATFLLDTTVLIDTLNDKLNRKALLRELLESGHILACCPINVAEVCAGMRPKEESATRQFLESLEYYAISRRAAWRAGELKREYARKGRTLSLTDLMIAAVAIEEGLTLLTDNVKDFPMRELSFRPLRRS